MVKPDARFLVPLSLLPTIEDRALAPEGARVWIGRHSVTANRHGDGLSPVDLLDASAPEVRPRFPCRLDVLPWLLGRLFLGATGCELDEDGDLWVYRGPGIGVGLVCGPARAAEVDGGAIVLPVWPDLSGLTPEEAARAVVVAVFLQARVPV